MQNGNIQSISNASLSSLHHCQFLSSGSDDVGNTGRAADVTCFLQVATGKIIEEELKANSAYSFKSVRDVYSTNLAEHGA